MTRWDAWRRVRALAPHRRLGDLHGRRVTVWKARSMAAARSGRGAARGPAPDGLRRVPARYSRVTAPARTAAYKVVRRVFEDEAYADRAMALAGVDLDPRDRALAQRIAYGHGSAHPHDRPRDRRARQRPTGTRLDPPVLAALRIVGYEIAWSEAPPHAVVNEVVELVRERRAFRTRRASRMPWRAGSPKASRRSSRRFHQGRLPSRTPTGSTRPGCGTGERRRRSR